ncbi:MAG: hypothetical protein VKO39_09005 [Cyanobacteriota bacterium]|nr:hypothetical protein [Cyanobacteriota bacterium]
MPSAAGTPHNHIDLWQAVAVEIRHFGPDHQAANACRGALDDRPDDRMAALAFAHQNSVLIQSAASQPAPINAASGRSILTMKGGCHQLIDPGRVEERHGLSC